jgi:N-acetylglutamate synthase-like GNAT family acetyltransferase
MVMEDIMIIDYRPEYAPDFRELNLEWIKKFFVVEEHDLEQLNGPEEYIISEGGHILFALHEGKVAGTCALVKTGENEYELAKMGVRPDMQGKQIGKALGLASLEKAKAIGARRVWLESSRVLTTAISLYKKLGFVEIPIDYSPYARADIRMEIII